MNTDFHFLNVVWGKSYTELFLQVSLPTQLTDGNLCAIGRGANNRYKLFTSSSDAETIRSSGVWKKLSSIITAEIHEMDEAIPDIINDDVDKYNTMTAAHRAGIMEGQTDPNIAFVFLTADIIFADGTFAAMRDLVNDGKRAVMTMAPRLTQESVVPELLKYLKEDEFNIVIPPRSLARLALNHLHPIAEASFWDSPNFFTPCPSNIYWRVNDEGIVARCPHLHPLLVKPLVREGNQSFFTVDDEYVMNSCPRLEDVHVVTESSRILLFTLTSVAEIEGEPLISMHSGVLIPNKADISFVADWMCEYTNSYHRFFAKYNIRLNMQEPSEAWEQVENQVDEIMRRCFRTYYLNKYLGLYTISLFIKHAWALCNPPLYWLYNKFERCYARAFHEYSRLKIAARKKLTRILIQDEH